MSRVVNPQIEVRPGALADAAISPRPQRGGVRGDIQALRAIAVLLVVAYHFFPGRISGGFVGVDVFFVISGFLITSHLLARPPRTTRDVLGFWGRRIRRLLPASYLVLIVSLVGTVAFAPQTVWQNVARQVEASAVYLENWFLAGQAVDYMAADTAASPVQHFWSLSVEEQFYLLWPILMLAVAWALARSKRLSGQRGITLAVGVIVAASFLYSVWITANDPAAAYFVSWGRAWELGAGALTACGFAAATRWLGGRNGVRIALSYAGLALIGYAALFYDAGTPFPGATAAIPVIGTALVLIAAVERGGASPLRAMEWRPIQFTGDISYSLYLWHWPLLILAPYALGHQLHTASKVAVVLLAFVLAWLSKVLVEDRLRGSRPLGTPMRRSFVFLIVGILVLVGCGFAVGNSVAGAAQPSRSASETIEHGLSDASSCVGAHALENAATCSPHGDQLLTSPVAAQNDLPGPDKDKCWIIGDFSKQASCHYGSSAPKALKVALVGNSHARQWLPAMRQLADDHGWNLTTYLISACYTVDVRVKFDTETKTQNCFDWNRKTIAAIKDGGYDLVVFANRTSWNLEGMDVAHTRVAAEASYGRVISEWLASGTRILVLRDTPYANDIANVPDCVAAHEADLDACDGTREKRAVADPLAAAAAKIHSARLAVFDPTNRICSRDTCYSVVGGLIVYYDRGHMSATFSRSLAPAVFTAAQRLVD